MAKKIYNNGSDGKILMSSAGKVIRQPYEFGNAFQNSMGLNNYISVPNINLTDTYSFLFIEYIYNEGITDRGGFQIKSTELGLADNVVFRHNTIVANIVDNTTFQAESIGGSYGVKYVSSSPTEVKIFNDLNNTIQSTKALRTNGVRNELNLGASNLYNTNSSAITVYMHPFSKLNRVYLFNRELSVSEIIYFKNNLLYSELQSSLGLLHDWNFKQAEVINISGVDQPCVRDYSGNNRHGIIMNLPAGTPQKKVDYANANLFVPFLS